MSVTRAGATTDSTIGALLDNAITSTDAYWKDGGMITGDPFTYFPTGNQYDPTGYTYDEPIGENPSEESVGGSGSTIDPEQVNANPDLGAWGSQLQGWLDDTVAGLPDWLSVFSMFGTFLGTGD